MIPAPRALALVILLAGALGLPAAALATTITVTTTADAVNGDGQCSLREAVIRANSDVSIDGECDPGPPGADVIVLGAGTYRLAVPGRGEDAGATGDLDVRSAVTIRGAGAGATTIDAGGIDRALDVLAAGDLRVDDLAVTGGAPGGTASDGADGGAIASAGALTIVDARIAGNAAGGGAAMPPSLGTTPALPGQSGAGVTAAGGGSGGDGGGVAARGVLVITRSVITGNRAGDGGRGGDGTGGSGNASSGGVGAGGDAGRGSGGSGGRGGHGGGVWFDGSALTVTDSLFSGNRSGAGGAGGTGTPGSAGGGSPAGAGAQGIGGAGGAGGRGGGLSMGFPGGTVTGSTFVGNVAGPGGVGGGSTRVPPPSGGTSLGLAVGGAGGPGGDGGGIGTAFGSAGSEIASLANVTFSANLASGGGGGGRILALPGTPGPGARGGRGGGVSSVGGTFNVQHATFSGNGAGTAGGAASAAGNADGAAGLPGTPGSGASANLASDSRDSIVHTIFAAGGCDTTTISLNDPLNVVSGAPGCNGTARDPRLAPPADNGGPVPTMRLLPGSGAIDAIGAAAGCPATDARGTIRPFGGGCDTGAYEVAPPVAATGAAGAITAGSAQIDGTVTTYGVPTPFRIDFGTTAAYGRQTAAGRAAGGTAPTPVSAGLSGLAPLTTYHYRVVALGADGTSNGADRTFTTAAVAVAGAGGPRVSGLSVRPGWFAVVPKGARPRLPRRGRVALGAVARFRLDGAATVRLAVDRPVRGRRVTLRSGRPGCVAVAAGRPVARAKRCTRHRGLGVLIRAGATGANAVVLTGRLGRRTLAPGRYRLVVTARAGLGPRSAPARAAFTVLPTP